jgi:alkaline phosphatase D
MAVWTACAVGLRSSLSETQRGASTDQAVPAIARIAFGSCNREWLPQPLWKPILATQPDLWIWLGDNIYADTHDMDVMRQKYAMQRADAGYRRLQASVPVIGVWDDHDYGANNVGKEYPYKAESQQLLLDFLDVPLTDPRRIRQGIYTSYTYGPAGMQVKVLLLDTRYHRDVPHPGGDILGAEQWQWLADELHQSAAQIHLIVSSIQILPEEHSFEKWANFPQARRRLLRLLGETGTPGVILLSGDRHLAEISRLDGGAVGYPLYEITASGLTHSWAKAPAESNRYRVGQRWTGLNFGLLVIEWHPNPVITLQIRDRQNRVRLEQRLELHQLQRDAAPQRAAAYYEVVMGGLFAQRILMAKRSTTSRHASLD